MKIIILICSLLPFALRAQLPPWNTKIIIQNPSGYTDTVWVGLEEEGDAGYQELLDIIDTDLNHPTGIRAYDSEVEAEFEFNTCTNLKKDIKKFTDEVTIIYTLIALTDEYPDSENFIIQWDTLDFIYNHEGMRLSAAWITSESGYINGIDNDRCYFFTTRIEGSDTINNFFNSSTYMYPFDMIYDCSDEAYAMSINLNVAFNMYPVEVESLDFSSQINIFPNPANDFVTISNQSNEQIAAEFYDLNGCMQMKTEFEKKGQFLINISTLPSGIYFIKT